VTICIALRAGPMVMGVSDRMLTSGDIQFEPAGSIKTVPWTTSIVMMQAGDAAFHTEIAREAYPVVQKWMADKPDEWVSVRNVVDLYIKTRNMLKAKKAEEALLAPLNLDTVSFIRRHKELEPEIAEQLTHDIINFEVPEVSVIVAGVDSLGPHIYVIQDSDVSCNDVVGFAAIGSGKHHAESQIMRSKHLWTAQLSDAALLGYLAKKRSEVAPGVGEVTDMFTIGPGLGTFSIVDEESMHKLAAIYDRIARSEERADKIAKKDAEEYVARRQKRREEEAAKSPPTPSEQRPPAESQASLPSSQETEKPSRKRKTPQAPATRLKKA